MWWVYVVVGVGALVLFRVVRRALRVAAFKRKYGPVWRREMYYRRYYATVEEELVAHLMYLKGEFNPMSRGSLVDPWPIPRSPWELPHGEILPHGFMEAYHEEFKKIRLPNENGGE